eukprot:Nitzschia sp. Nitz4//scaffold38_size140716//131879//133552//NITZ4_003177-RA/size140716-processed-gene-0.48-mRNA-1//1//CDS//3329550168//2413//frame0
MAPHNTSEKPESAEDVSMKNWLQRVTPEERDAMSAYQLDYRFQGDNFSSMWWLHLQELGVKHNGGKYSLPDSAPDICSQKTYTSSEIYERLDSFAIPLLTSSLETFPTEDLESRNPQQLQEENWWRDIRDQLIFKKFHKSIESLKSEEEENNKKNSRSNSKIDDPTSAPTRPRRRRRSSSGQDGGADLLLRKRKREKSLRSEELSNVSFPRLSEYISSIKDASKDLDELEGELVGHFEEWMFQGVLNQSVLLYGVGSKQSLLDRFAKRLESEGDVMVVNGYDKDVQLDGILNAMVACWLGGRNPNPLKTRDLFLGRPFDLDYCSEFSDSHFFQLSLGISKALADRASMSKRPFYLVIHNLDGIMLRDKQLQEVLSVLVDNSKTTRGLRALRLVASIDHINSPAPLWDTLTWARFNWSWAQVDTLRPYQSELTRGLEDDTTSSNPSRQQQGRSSSRNQDQSIFGVLSSLAPRVTEVLQELARFQMEKVAKGENWVAYKALLRQCVHKCIISSDHTMRSFLGELSDHRIVELNNEEGSDSMCRIPRDVNTLRQILEYRR